MLSSGYYNVTVRELFVLRISHATVQQFADCLIKGIIPRRAHASRQETQADPREQRLDV